MKNKKLLIILIILLFVLVILSTTVLGMIFNKSSCDSCLEFANKNPKTVFSINKCIMFSSCNAKSKNNSSSLFTLENLYQYTDIALFINNNSSECTLENTLKSVKISNLQFSKKPSIGTPKVFYKNVNSFAENSIPETNQFENEIVFNVSSEDNEDLNNPILYNNCANPIVLSYINENIKSDYTIPDTSSPITYDGSLLKRCNVLLNSLNSKFSFDIYITNNLDQEFKCTVFIEPPIENYYKSLYDGSITTTEHTNYNFYRYK